MNVAAVVLAAGAGRRLGGRNKAALRLADGQSFLDAVVAGARAVAARVVVVVAAPHAAAVRAMTDAETVENPAPERGMASSIACGLAALDASTTDAALVWPVDTPRVAPATVAAVVAAGARGAIVIPVHGGHGGHGGRGGHPTLFGAELWPALAATDNARKVIAAEAARVVRLAVDDPGVLRDVDTVEDLA